MNRPGFNKLLVFTCLLLVQIMPFADEHESDSTEAQTTVTQPQQPASQENNTPSESFVPTESISEDLSVPFPVDI